MKSLWLRTEGSASFPRDSFPLISGTDNANGCASSQIGFSSKSTHVVFRSANSTSVSRFPSRIHPMKMKPGKEKPTRTIKVQKNSLRFRRRIGQNILSPGQGTGRCLQWWWWSKWRTMDEDRLIVKQMSRNCANELTHTIILWKRECSRAYQQLFTDCNLKWWLNQAYHGL